MLDIVCTPTPFIVGLLSSSLPQLTELPLEEVRGHILSLTMMECDWNIVDCFIILDVLEQVLVVDLGNSRFLRQVGHSQRMWR